MKKQEAVGKAAQLRQGQTHPFGMLGGYTALGGGEAALYRTIRQAVPVLDAAVGKLVRLTGGFTAVCADKQAQRRLRECLRTVPVGRGQYGIECFLSAYLDSLLTYGRTIGEMVLSGGELAAVCWGDVTRIHVCEGENPLDFSLGVYESGKFKALPYPALLLFSTWNPEPENPYGVSLFRSMPFLTDVLLKIYNTIGVNWERAGNVRYSVVYRPKDGAADADADAARACVRQATSPPPKSPRRRSPQATSRQAAIPIPAAEEAADGAAAAAARTPRRRQSDPFHTHSAGRSFP